MAMYSSPYPCLDPTDSAPSPTVAHGRRGSHRPKEPLAPRKLPSRSRAPVVADDDEPRPTAIQRFGSALARSPDVGAQVMTFVALGLLALIALLLLQISAQLGRINGARGAYGARPLAAAY